MRAPSSSSRAPARGAAVAAILLTAVLVSPSTPAVALPAGGNLCALGPRTSLTSGADLVVGTAGDDA